MLTFLTFLLFNKNIYSHRLIARMCDNSNNNKLKSVLSNLLTNIPARLIDIICDYSKAYVEILQYIQRQKKFVNLSICDDKIISSQDLKINLLKDTANIQAIFRTENYIIIQCRSYVGYNKYFGTCERMDEWAIKYHVMAQEQTIEIIDDSGFDSIPQIIPVEYADIDNLNVNPTPKGQIILHSTNKVLKLKNFSSKWLTPISDQSSNPRVYNRKGAYIFEYIPDEEFDRAHDEWQDFHEIPNYRRTISPMKFCNSVMLNDDLFLLTAQYKHTRFLHVYEFRISSNTFTRLPWRPPFDNDDHQLIYRNGVLAIIYGNSLYYLNQPFEINTWRGPINLSSNGELVCYH